MTKSCNVYSSLSISHRFGDLVDLPIRSWCKDFVSGASSLTFAHAGWTLCEDSAKMRKCVDGYIVEKLGALLKMGFKSCWG